MKKTVIYTALAPAAIGTYSQAIKVDNTVYLSGQIPLLADSMELISDQIQPQIEQVFKNLSAVANAAGGGLHDVVKLNIYLTDMGDFAVVNELMAHYFSAPYPARAAVGVAHLPKGSRVEMDAVMVLDAT